MEKIKKKKSNSHLKRLNSSEEEIYWAFILQKNKTKSYNVLVKTTAKATYTQTNVSGKVEISKSNVTECNMNCKHPGIKFQTKKKENEK